MNETLSIGQLAQELGVRTSAIRFYESEGLLEPTARVSGQRRYSPSARARVSLIKLAQGAGFTIAEILQLLQGFPAGATASQRWGSLIKAKRLEIERRQKELEAMSDILERLASCSCPSLDDCGAAAQQFNAQFREATQGPESRSESCCKSQPKPGQAD